MTDSEKQFEQEAVCAAAAHEIGMLFAVLVANLSHSSMAAALSRFEAGLAHVRAAKQQVLTLIDRSGA
jgi:hypothetical protein